MPPPSTVTVLHVSDMQFGEHHRFDGNGLADALLRDLADLRKSHAIVPSIVVAAGDLTETAMPAEYRMVHEFLVALRDGLGLDTKQIVAVPGNHDVSRKKCQAYFLSCDADGEDPKPPYWPKWEPYAAFHGRFYGTDFPKDEPWIYVELRDLGVAVAGLNSTYADSHRKADQHGHLGDKQLRYFAALMKQSDNGWLRLGVMHHNLVRGTGHDDAYVHDARQFEEILASHLDLVLHGHTHDARVQSFGADAMSVLGSGSAGVTVDRRPPEVPNQYQLVQVTGDQVRV